MALELEPLVTRLVGDASSYVKMLTDAIGMTSEYATQTESLTKQAADATSSQMQVIGKSIEQVASVTPPDITVPVSADTTEYIDKIDSINKDIKPQAIPVTADLSEFKNQLEKMQQLEKEAYDKAKGKEITVSVETKGEKEIRVAQEAAQKYQSTVNELNRLLAQGTITQETYNRAVAKSQVELDKASVATQSLGQKLLSIGATIGAAAWLKESEGLYKVQAAAERQLRGALEVTGQEVEKSFKRFTDYASGLQKVTTIGDEVSIGLLKQATLLGLNNEQAERAVRNSIALAAVHGGEAASYIRMTAMLEQGRLGRLGMLLGMGDLEEQIDETGQAMDRHGKKAEQVKEAQEKLAKMFEYAKKEASSLGGQIKQMENAYGDMREQFGKVIAEASKPVRVAILDTQRRVISFLSDLPDVVKKIAVAALALTTGLGGLKLISPLIATGFTAITTAAGTMIKAILLSPWTWFIAGTVGAVAGIKALYTAMYDASEAGKFLNQHIKEMGKNTAVMIAKMDELTTEILDAAGGMKGKFEGLDYLQSKLAAAEKHAESLKKSIEEVKGKNIELKLPSGIKVPGINIESALTPDQKAFKKDAEARAEAAEKMVKRIKEAIDNLKKGKPVNTELAAEVGKLNKSLEEQVELFGLNGAAAEIQKLKLKDVTEEQLNTARNLHKNLQIQELDRQIAINGMSQEEIKKYDLIRADKLTMDALDEQKKQLKDLNEEMDNLNKRREADSREIRNTREKYKELTDAIETLKNTIGKSETKQKEILDKRKIVELQEASNKAEEEFAKLVHQADELNKRFRTPAQEYNDTIQELNELLGAGLHQDAYNKAVDEAKMKLNDAAGSAKDFKEQLQGIQGVATGSAEALARLNAYTAGLEMGKAKVVAPTQGRVEPLKGQQIKDIDAVINKNKPAGDTKEAGILREIRDILKGDANKPKVELKKANL